MLYKAAPDLIVPVLRPYRRRGEIGTWVRDPTIVPHVEARLKANTYAGIGEFHVFGADADLPVMRRLVELAKERKIFLHAHSDADAVERIFKQDPDARVLWAHSGFDQPDNVRAMLAKHKMLWADLAFRNDYAPGGPARRLLAAAHHRFPRPLHGGHRYALAGALVLRGRARQLLAQVARRPARRRRRQHRLPQRRAARRVGTGTMSVLAAVRLRCLRPFWPRCARPAGLGLPHDRAGLPAASRRPMPRSAYRWEPAELKVGQFFTAEVVTCRAPNSEPVREIRIDATMPAHGHGMNYRPAAARTAPGHYRFTGLMLHMPGTWRSRSTSYREPSARA